MDNWQIYKLRDITTSFSGGTPLTDHPEFYEGGHIPFITSRDLNESPIKKIPHTITQKGLENSSAKIVKENTLLFALYGATAGACAITQKSGAINQAVLALVNCKINEKLLYYVLSWKKDYILRTYTQGGQPNLSAQIVNNLSFFLPTDKQEENLIVEVLETWDKAIQLTRQLIEQKELQKKYLMQQLLTGRTRLKGFTDKWENVRLKQLCSIQKGQQLNANTLTKNGKYACLNGGIIPSGYTTKWNTEANTISISEGGNSCGYVNWNDSRFWAGGHCYTLANVKISNSFLYFVLKNKEGHIMNLRVGSGLPNIQRPSLEKLLLKIPSAQKEQQDIAQVLSSCDKEIDLLKQKLTKLEEQKKGLMQVLLTGKVRLAVRETK